MRTLDVTRGSARLWAVLFLTPLLGLLSPVLGPPSPVPGLPSSVAQAAPLGQRQVLPSGMVLLVSEKRAVPIVTATMLIQAGAILDPSDKAGLANLTAELLTQGTKTRTATQVSEAIEFVGGPLSVEAGQDVTTVTLSVLSRDLDLGLDLLADILLNPTFAPDEI
ncbi:MAG: insulinase family protein, partial [candidate division NC10 bacterium]|nr:insulinase family protein [candidate division NC10 bacterium]